MIKYTDPLAYETIQKDVTNKLASYLGKSKLDIQLIVIVGAYHGYEIDALLCNYPNATLYAFEPYPDHFKKLESRYKDNSRVKVINKAVSDREGTSLFHELTSAGSGSLLEFIEDGYNKIANTIEVTCTTINKTFPDLVIDLLWVDTQGTELDVIRGANLINVSSLFLEVTLRSGKIAYKNNTLLDELEDYLRPTHYLHSLGLDNESNNGTGNSFWSKV